MNSIKKRSKKVSRRNSMKSLRSRSSRSSRRYRSSRSSRNQRKYLKSGRRSYRNYRKHRKLIGGSNLPLTEHDIQKLIGKELTIFERHSLGVGLERNEDVLFNRMLMNGVKVLSEDGEGITIKLKDITDDFTTVWFKTYLDTDGYRTGKLINFSSLTDEDDITITAQLSKISGRKTSWGRAEFMIKHFKIMKGGDEVILEKGTEIKDELAVVADREQESKAYQQLLNDMGDEF